MDKNEILQRIINEEGNCSWANRKTCAQCPLSRLMKRPDGNYYSCVEAVGAADLTEEQADAKYKEIATRLLMDEAIDELLIKPDEE
jgi:hypothetical protein